MSDVASIFRIFETAVELLYTLLPALPEPLRTKVDKPLSMLRDALTPTDAEREEIEAEEREKAKFSSVESDSDEILPPTR